MISQCSTVHYYEFRPARFTLGLALEAVHRGVRMRSLQVSAGSSLSSHSQNHVSPIHRRPIHREPRQSMQFQAYTLLAARGVDLEIDLILAIGDDSSMINDHFTNTSSSY